MPRATVCIGLMDGLRIALLCGAAIVAAERGLTAHAELLRSNPAAGSVVAAPSRVELTFSERVDVPPDAIVVFDPGGTRVNSGAAVTRPGNGATMVVLLGKLSSGTHSVQWRAISDDGHPVSGSFQFSVGAPSAAVQPKDSDSESAAIWAVAGRAMHLAALSLLIGPPTLLLVVGVRDGWTRDRLWQLSWWGALALIPAALTMFLAQSLAISDGEWNRALAWSSISGLATTGWGEIWLARTVFIAIVIGLLERARRRRSGHVNRRAISAVTAAAIVLIPFTALNGHSATTPPVWLSLPVDWVHLAATAVWLGGLAGLIFAVLPGARRMSHGDRNRAIAIAIPRFSTLALGCVQFLLVTGMYHAWAHVDAPASLASTSYGRTLLVKLGLVGLMLIPAALNLLYLRPRLVSIDAKSSGSGLLRALRRSVGVELALAVIVLLVVGRLTSIAPARAEAAAPSGSAPEAAGTSVPAATDSRITLADGTGSTFVLLTVSPIRVGANRLDIELQDGSGAMLHPSQIRLRISPPDDIGMSSWVVVPASDGHRYYANTDFSADGTWKVDVLTQSAAGAQATASFAFDVPMSGAQALLTAAGQRMNRLHSAAEESETLTGRAEELQTAVYEPPFSLPEPADDPVILRREAFDGVECFVVEYVAADSSHQRVWIAADSLLVRRVESASPGHIVRRRFSNFDR